MPYSPPSYSSGRSSSPSFSHHSRSVSPHSHQNQNQNPSHSLGRPGHRRSYSSQSQFGFGSGSGSSPRSASPSSNTRFSNEWSPNGNVNGGAWSGLGALPRRHSSAPPTSKFQIGDRRGGGSSSEEEDHDSALPPLKLKVQVLPSFSQGVPFPKSSSDSPVQNGPIPIPLPPTVPSNVTMTRSSNPALARTASSPAVTQPSSTANSPAGVPAVILLSTGKPLRSSLKGSRASSVLGSPIGSAAPSPSTSPRPSPDHSATNSVVGSPMTSPLIDGMPAPSFGSLASFGGPDSNPNSNYLLAPPSASASVLFSGHVRAQSAPSPPSGSDAYPSPAATPLGPLSPSLSECAALMSPGGTLLSPRNVHFPSLSSDLEHVKLFRKEARPSSLLITRKELTNNVHSNRSVNGVEGTEAEADGAGSGNGGEETETETETDRDYGYGYRSYWGSGTWGGKGLWNAAAPSKTSPGTKNQTQPDRSANASSFPFPRLPRLGRARTPGSKDDGSSSESDSTRARKIGTGTEKADAEHVEYALPHRSRSRSKKVKVELDMSPAVQIPRPESVRDALLGMSASTNVFLEELHLEAPSESTSSSLPLVLEGSFLVRNITFEKHVFVRFTADSWATVSEVRGKWVGSVGRSHLISLLQGRSSGVNPPRTLGDIVAIPATSRNENENQAEWDRFAFRITLPPAVGPGRIVEFVGRFTTGNAGGEWWDNNGGKNWRVGFKEVDVVEVSTPAPAPLLLKVSPTTSLSLPSRVPAPAPPKAEKAEEEAISPLPVNVPIPAFAADNDLAVAANVDAEAPAELEREGDSLSQDHSLTNEASIERQIIDTPESQSALSMTTPVVDSEDTIKSEAIINEADSNGAEDAASLVKEPKERAPKPTGLGSLTGLGGLFWPWRGSTPNQDHLDSPKSTVEDPNSSGSGSGGSSDSTLKAPRSVSLDTRASPRWSPSGSGNASPGAKKLPASATVEVLSIIPPVPSPTSTSRRFPISPASIPFPSTSSPKLQSARERERIPSTSSLSSNSSIESMDSMMDVPVLERSASLSSVSTDGDGELAELADILHSQASVNLPSELHFGDHAWMETELTPVPNEMRAPWSGDFKYSPPRDDVNPEVGFFDKSGPGAGGVGVAAPEKPLDADPLYKAFVQQWCFAGAGNRSPAPTNNRNGLQVS